MARKRRTFSVFSLSFLDIMSCGFGATVLIFLIMDHASEVRSQEINRDLISEVNFLEKEVLEGERDLAELRNTIALVDQAIVEAQGKSRKIIDEIKRREDELSDDENDSLAKDEHINKLKADIRQLEEDNRRLRAEGEKQQGRSVRQFVGDGDRQYLTGLKLGGKRILILLDTSASMLDARLVNIIRLRNMPAAVQAKSEKWQQALSTVSWLSSQLPKQSQVQIFGFNTEAKPALEKTAGSWMDVANREQLNEAIENLGKTSPSGGTSLANAFKAIGTLNPAPDNIYLITDGLPTQGASRPSSNNASGRDRVKYFNQAIELLPKGIPVNVILAPMEGDPWAASAFWKLALSTRGAFVAPSKDWP